MRWRSGFGFMFLKWVTQGEFNFVLAHEFRFGGFPVTGTCLD